MFLFFLITLSLGFKDNKVGHCIARCAMMNYEQELKHPENTTKEFDNFEFVKYCFDSCKFEFDNEITRDTLIEEGIEVTKEELREGDLVFSKNKEAQIYIGHGKVAYVPQNKENIYIENLDKMEGFKTARRVILEGETLKGSATYTVVWTTLNKRKDPARCADKVGEWKRGDKIESLGLVRNSECAWIKFKTFWGNIRYSCAREYDNTCYVSPCPSFK